MGYLQKRFVDDQFGWRNFGPHQGQDDKTVRHGDKEGSDEKYSFAYALLGFCVVAAFRRLC